MKRSQMILLALGIPVLLIFATWQAGRYATLAAEARALEAVQADWLRENRKLAADIGVLSSREKIDSMAQALGLQKASPERRLHIVAPGKGSGKSDG